MSPAEVRETGHLLQNLGWTELFAYLCPGAITLMSLAFWIRPNLECTFGEQIAHNEFVVAIVFLLLSYAAGLPVAVASEAGANKYLLTIAERRMLEQKPNFRSRMLGFFFWIPQLRSTKESVRARLHVLKQIEGFGLSGVSTLSSWTNLAIYRTLVAERLLHPATLVLQEAERVHRRRLFALGVGFALIVVSVQGLIRTILLVASEIFAKSPAALSLASLPATSLGALLSITLLTGAASFGLRWVAGRFWECKFLLTCSDPLKLDLETENEKPDGRSKLRSLVDAVLDALQKPNPSK